MSGEQLLTVPTTDAPEAEAEWVVVARTARVNRSWQELIERAPKAAARCYSTLRTAPMTRQPGRVFPLKGKTYKGAWEYEVTRGDRVFYCPDPINRKVVVYYAGKHPDPAPTPP